MQPASLVEARLPRRSFGIMFAVSLVMAIGNMGLISVLPAISRSTGMPDEAAVAIFALSSLFWAFCSPMWARATDRHGRKPLIVLGLAGFTGSKMLAGLIVVAGLAHLAPWPVIFLSLLLARGLFGFFGSASSPATQAYVAEYTPPEERTGAISGLAGAWGLGTVIGPFIAPLLVLPFVGLSGPLFGVALVGLAMLLVVVRYLPESERREIVLEAPTDGDASGKPPPMWRDMRLRPFLIYGFLVSVCQTVQSQTLGFLIIDKLHLSPLAAQRSIAVAMMFGAVAGLTGQWGLIRIFRMTPRQLLRWGVALAAVGNLLVAFSPAYWVLVLGFSLSALGYSFARPGFTAGASLSVKLGEQARTAGAIAMVNGANGLLAPAFVWLYRQLSWAPFLLNAVVLAALFGYAFANLKLRTIDVRPAADEELAVF
jgi:MFS family permease